MSAYLISSHPLFRFARRSFWGVMLCAVFCTGQVGLQGQNLAPNPSFEDFTNCPIGYGQGGPLPCTPWQSATAGTADYLHVCANPGTVGVPTNNFGFQNARTGQAYVGGYSRFVAFEYREYVMAPLVQPLVAGTNYYVAFYVSLADNTCGIETMGALFTPSPPVGAGFLPLTNYTPQIEYSTGFLSDKQEWMLVEGCFFAEGGEQYITIGNFHSDAETVVDPSCMPFVNSVYYYIDDVQVEAITTADIDFDLGGPVMACTSYEIESGITGVNYQWSTGATTSSITVQSSGLYYLTVSAGCDRGIDSIEVTIYDAPPVDLGPPLVLLCEGDTYTISLPPGDGTYTWQDGSTGPIYNITTGGIYQVTLDDGCGLTSDQIEINMVDIPPPFTLGADTVLCPGTEIEYFFEPSLGNFQWQDNSMSNSYIIVNPGVYALTISNMCGDRTDEIEIALLEWPEVELWPSVLELCDLETYVIQLDPNEGLYMWQDGSVQTSYVITEPGLYSVTVTNSCGSASDDMQVIYYDAPSFDLGPSLTACPGDTIVLAAPGVLGTYLWQDGSNAPTYTVTGPGNYSLIVSNLCGTGSDMIQINFEAPISAPDLGPDISSCATGQVVLYANSPGAQFLWQDMSTADSLLVTTSGTYYVEASNACASLSDTIVVQFNGNGPQLMLPAQLTLCQGQTLTIDAGIGGVTYLWNDGSQNDQLNISAPGTYSLTVTNICGMDTDTVLVADGGPAPMVDLGANVSICPGESILLTPTFDQVDNWQWPDGSTNDQFLVTTPGVVDVIVSNACGTAYDTITIGQLTPTPPLDLGNDTSLCPGETLLLTINIPAVDIEWFDGSTSPSILLNGPGVYTAMISNSCGTSSDMIEITSLPVPPALDLGADLPLCPGEILIINPGISGVTYLWHDGSTASQYSISTPGTVALTISTVCGSSSDAVVIFESTDGPQLDLGPDILACENESVILAPAISGVSFMWQDGSTLSTLTVSTSGTYSLTVSNSCGQDTDTVMVEISGTAPMPDLGLDTTLCDGEMLQLVSLADTETTIAWQDGTSTAVYTVTTAGTYILTENNRCGSAADTLIVGYMALPPAFNLGPDTTLCPGEILVLTAPVTTFDIRWQNGATAASLVADQAGTYSLTLSNDCGAVADELILTYDNRMPQVNLGNDISWCEGEVFTLNATQPFAATYTWNTGSTAPMITISLPGTFSVEVVTPCITVTDEVVMFDGNDCIRLNDIYIPNVFSPNGDNVNDVFTPFFGSDLSNMTMSGAIYDRWGNLVFASTSTSFSWDGRFNATYVMPGVYVYVIKMVYLERDVEREMVFTGDVTVIR